jgi:hypothetical protein
MRSQQYLKWDQNITPNEARTYLKWDQNITPNEVTTVPQMGPEHYSK